MLVAQSICSIVVTFHPTLVHVENIAVLASQVDLVIVVDNGSSADEIAPIRALANLTSLILIENQDNLGVARALNQGIGEASRHRCTWINLFDQDSRITSGYMQQMISDYGSAELQIKVGMLIPRYLNPQNGTERIFIKSPGYKTDKLVIAITSGSLFRPEILERCGKFCEELFIYVIDDEYSLRLQRSGYAICQSNSAILLHASGDPRPFTVLGRYLFTTTNHSPMARYYVNRNRIWLLRRYGTHYPIWFVRLGLLCVKDLLRILLAEDQRKTKLLRICQGIRDGLLDRMGKAAL